MIFSSIETARSRYASISPTLGTRRVSFTPSRPVFVLISAAQRQSS
jgi:hypothetical protein